MLARYLLIIRYMVLDNVDRKRSMLEGTWPSNIQSTSAAPKWKGGQNHVLG